MLPLEGVVLGAEAIDQERREPGERDAGQPERDRRLLRGATSVSNQSPVRIGGTGVQLDVVQDVGASRSTAALTSFRTSRFAVSASRRSTRAMVWLAVARTVTMSLAVRVHSSRSPGIVGSFR